MYKSHQSVLDLVSLLALHGVKTAVLCPGSRCAPLSLALARHPSMVCYTITDERSAGYVALGMAQQLGTPVVLVCTSGTAALNFAPAVAEAFYQNIPLLVLTADRPPEWLHQEDGQAINQTDIYKNFVAKSYTLPIVQQAAEANFAQRLANEAINTCIAQQQPVHINVPLREPLYDIAPEVVQPNVRFIKSQMPQIASCEPISFSEKTLFILGQQNPNAEFSALLQQVLQKNHQITAYAEPCSNVFLEEVQYNVSHIKNQKYHSIVCFGGSVVSKELKLLLRQNPPNELFNVGKRFAHADAFSALSTIIPSSGVDFLRAVNELLPAQTPEPKPQQTTDAPHSDALVAQIFGALPSHCILHLANSMSVRYAGQHAGALLHKNLSVYSNRGTSGIDGCTSTALGAALVSAQTNALVTGDLAFLYDSNALWNKYKPANLKIIVLNDGGGGIFGKIAGPKDQPEFDEYFFTPQNVGISQLCAAYNASHFLLDSSMNFEAVFSSFINQKQNNTSVLEVVL